MNQTNLQASMPYGRIRPQLRSGAYPQPMRVNSQTQFRSAQPQFQRAPQQFRQASIQPQFRRPMQQTFLRAPLNTAQAPRQRFAFTPKSHQVVAQKKPGFFDGFFSLGINPPKQVAQRKRQGMVRKVITLQRRSAMLNIFLRR